MSIQFTILTCRKFSCQISHAEAWGTISEWGVLSGELREKNVYHFIWLGPLIIPVADAAVATCICVTRLSVGWQVHFSNGTRDGRLAYTFLVICCFVECTLQADQACKISYLECEENFYCLSVATDTLVSTLNRAYTWATVAPRGPIWVKHTDFATLKRIKVLSIM